MEYVKKVLTQTMVADGKPVDPKMAVGTGQTFATIDELLTYPDLLSSGMLVDDYDYSVTWQVYLDPYNVSSEPIYKARLYDGTFYVKACYMYEDFTNYLVDKFYGTTYSIDGVTVEDGDIVLITGFDFPQMHGVWIVREDDWERHSIFNDSADKLTGVTFVVQEGTLYANTQWTYITRGDTTPSVLCTDWSMYGDSPETWATYTWLNFEMVGGEHPVTNHSVETPNINSNNYLTIFGVDSSGGATVVSSIPGKTYSVVKEDETITNVVSFPTFYKNYTTGDFTPIPLGHYLLHRGDWIDFTLGTNNGVDYLIRSNRINRIIIMDDISEDGKLSQDLSSNDYFLYISGIATGVSENNPVLNIGTSERGNEITPDAPLTFTIGELITVGVPGTSITELWVSGTWNGAVVTFYVHIVKDDI